MPVSVTSGCLGGGFRLQSLLYTLVCILHSAPDDQHMFNSESILPLSSAVGLITRPTPAVSGAANSVARPNQLN